MTRISRQAVGAPHPDLSGAIRTLGLTGVTSIRQAVGVLYPDLSSAPISEEIKENYKYNTQETWKTNSNYAKVNRRSRQNQFLFNNNDEAQAT